MTIDVELNANYVCGGLYEQDLTIYSNDSDQPQITIPCSLEIEGTPSYSASATSFDFGELQQFDTNTQPLIINNPGNYELNVDITSSNAGFVVEPSTFTVPGCDGSITVAVTFAPLEVQTYTGTLTIQTNAAPFPFTIPLTGSSVGAPITSITPNPIEVSVMTGETTTQDITISNTGIGPLTYNIDTSGFDSSVDVVIFNNPSIELQFITNLNTILSDYFPGQYTSTNTNAVSANQLSAALENADIFVVPTTFDIATVQLFAGFGNVLQNFADQGGTVLFFGTMAWNGANYQAPITESGLFPDALLAFNSGDFITLPDPNHPLVDDLNGSFESNGFYALQLPDSFDGISLLDQTEFPGEPGSGGSILASRDIGQGRAIFFGSSSMGFPSDHDRFVFRNIVQWTKTTRLAEWLDLNGVVTDGYIPSNQTGVLTATFDSGNLLGGVYTTEIEVVTNDPVQPTITIPVIMTVIGVPQISVDVLSLDYGALVIGDNDGQSITISNPGTDNLIINSISTSDPAFTTSASSLTIPPFGSANLTVTFAPAAIQNYNATLSLDNNATDLTIALTGQGQGAPISSASPDQISVSLEEGQTSSQSVTLSNGAAAAGNFSWVVNGDGAPQVVLLRYGSDQFLFNNLLSYLATYAPTAINTEFNSNNAQELGDVLEGKDLIIIPQQQQTPSVLAAMAAFGPVLTEFVANGGSVLFAGSFCDQCINNTGLLTGNYFTSLFGGTPMTILDESHPMTAGIPDGYIPFYNVTAWQFSNPGFVTLATDPTGEGTAIGYLPTDGGNILFWGFDFNSLNDVVMGASLGTTVSFGAGELPDWLTITPFSGTTPSGQNSTITVNFDSEGLATGVYQYTIVIYTNDPLNPIYTVPCTMNVIAMPEAAIGANSTLGCGTGTIQFSDETANVATSWSWNFGDGATSTEQNPSHTYAANGTYTVTLNACNDLGCDEIVLTNYITIDLSCEYVVLPTFGEVSSSQCNGVVQDHGGDGNYFGSAFTTFTINTPDAQGVILSFSEFNTGNFDFLLIYQGDQTTGTLVATLNGMAIPESLTIEGPLTTILWQSESFQNLPGFTLNWQCIAPTVPPIPNFSSEVIVECLGQVQFTDLSSNYPNTYTWDFGDGTTSDEENPEHFYAASGTYDVTLNACNPIGCEEVTIPVTIQNVLFVDVNIPYCTNVNTPVLLDDNTIGAVDWTWVFGNGNGAQGLASPITFYSTPGTYTITLTVTNANGCERTITQDIIIVPAGQPCPVSVQNPNLEAGVSVSPNPTTGLFSIDYAFDGVQNIGYRVFDCHRARSGKQPSHTRDKQLPYRHRLGSTARRHVFCSTTNK
ncbi:MAG: PKD domain-containing protein [Sphingobacteriales bacterium]|nr:PKD domain-containing protein [Sphingobacteriales bacterium]